MGKRLEDLHLDPAQGPDAQDGLREARDRHAALLLEVRELLEDGAHDFAWGYLQDLERTLSKGDFCTEAQEQAVQNIKEGQARHAAQLEGWGRHAHRTGRRYDGFDTRLK
jgi:hypothetical protein